MPETENDEFFDKEFTTKFTRLEDRVPGESWIMMLYGPSKTGKTEFAGSAGPRTLFLNIGEGIETLLAPGFKSRHPEAKGMIVTDIRELADNTISAFDVVSDTIDHALKYFPDKFDTIVVDEASAFRKFGLNKAMQLNTSSRKDSSRKDRRDEYVKAEIGDYGIEMDMIEWFLGEYIPRLKGANKHFILIAHERQIFAKPSQIGGEAVLTKIVPGFTGKTFPDKVPAYFDDVWHSEIATDAASNSVYRIRTAGNDRDLGGSRHGGIFNVIEQDPNFLKLLQRIKEAQPRPILSLRKA